MRRKERHRGLLRKSGKKQKGSIKKTCSSHAVSIPVLCGGEKGEGNKYDRV